MSRNSESFVFRSDVARYAVVVAVLVLALIVTVASLLDILMGTDLMPRRSPKDSFQGLVVGCSLAVVVCVLSLSFWCAKVQSRLIGFSGHIELLGRRSGEQILFRYVTSVTKIRIGYTLFRVAYRSENGAGPEKSLWFAVSRSEEKTIERVLRPSS
jgi:CDP-diglyceride synthetase